MALKDMTDDDRAYLQGLIDDFYEHFIERVTEGRELDGEAVRDTEARVYLGDEAEELGLVDDIGAREEVKDHLEDELGAPIQVREFTPETGLAERLRGGAQGLAHAFGAGVASAFSEDDVAPYWSRL